MNTNALGKKVYKLQKILRELGSAVVAYSGGVDSTFLLYASRRVLGKDNVLAAIVHSPAHPREELKAAKKTAGFLDTRYTVIEGSELSDKNFRSNLPDRCYHCKKALFKKLARIAKGGYRCVLDGANYDDRKDYRAGDRAAREFGVKRPLAQVGLRKDEIRRLSRAVGLPTHDKPQQACLATRIPYFEEITKEKLSRVEKAEEYLRRLGFFPPSSGSGGEVYGLRVRHHGGIARIELSDDAMKRFLDDGLRKKIVRRLRNLGFSYVALDMEGYRPGSLNREINNWP